jgi:hypothetical protein
VYRTGEHQAADIVSAATLIHPYGMIAPLWPRTGIPFGSNDTLNVDYVGLSNNVKMFTEQMTNQERLHRIHEQMVAAEQIVFLGFGFHSMNLALLRPPQKMRSKRIYGTALGKSDSSVRLVKQQLASMFESDSIITYENITLSDMKCADLLDYHENRLPN